MLGVRRPTVTLIINDLANSGIVSTGRGMVRIVDRAALEARACVCYRTVVASFSARPLVEAKLVRAASIL